MSATRGVHGERRPVDSRDRCHGGASSSSPTLELGSKRQDVDPRPDLVALALGGKIKALIKNARRLEDRRVAAIWVAGPRLGGGYSREAARGLAGSHEEATVPEESRRRAEDHDAGDAAVGARTRRVPPTQICSPGEVRLARRWRHRARRRKPSQG